MAVRRTILLIGDRSAAGQIAVSGLTAIGAGYAATQTDFQIWDIQDQAWEDLTPGVNSNPTSLPSGTYWGLESRLREALRDRFASETLYCIKHTPDASLLPNSANGNWDPGAAGEAFADLITEVTAAASEAALAGDTLSIEAIAISIQTEDFKYAYWRSYASAMESLIDALRSSLAAHATMGSLRDDGGLTPVVVIEPHYSYGSLTDAQSNQLFSIRASLYSIENEDNRVSIVRSHSYNSHTDDKTFDAESMVDQSVQCVQQWFPQQYDDGANQERMIVGLFGDSTAEGWLTDNTLLPTHQQQALSGAYIWSPSAGQWATLQAGVNNLVSVPNSPFTGHGFEINLGDKFRSLGNVYLVKGSQINSTASDYRGLLSVSTGPHGQRRITNWAQGRGQLADMHIRGTLRSAIEHLRRQNFKPKIGPLIISVGLNDSNLAGLYDSNPNSVVLAIRGLMNQIKRMMVDLNVDATAMKFIVCVPAEWAVNASGAFSSDPVRLSRIREDLLALPITEPDVFVVDFTEHAASNDSYHLSTAGTRTASEAIWTAWNALSSTAVEPLFAPSMGYLRSAMRLSNIAETNDALDMIDQATLHARTRFFRDLGDSRIQALRSIAFTRDPRTTDAHLRIMAVDTEIKIVRAQLMRVMPMSFMDGMAPQQVWQEEAAFREGGYLQIKDELKRIESEVVQNMDILMSADLSKYSGDVESFGNDNGDSPGDTVFGAF